MLATPAVVWDGLMRFAESEVLPALDGWQLWTASAALIQLTRRAEILIPELLANPALKALGIVDKDGNVDVESAIGAMKDTVKSQGKLEINVPLIGMLKFGESDFDKLLEHIKTASDA